MLKPLKESFSSAMDPFNSLKEWTRDGMQKRIYDFSEGTIEDRNHLGLKGAYLCEISKQNLPVPPGFIVTSEACQDFFSVSNSMGLSPHLKHNLCQGVSKLEKTTERKFMTKKRECDPDSLGCPLLLSIRSSTTVKMPGMTDTILNLGINSAVCQQLGRHFNNPKFALDVYRRFLQMFGTIVFKIPKQQYHDILKEERAACGVGGNAQLDYKSLQVVVERFKALAEVPDDPHEQLQMAIEAIFCSWYNNSAMKFREMNHLDEKIGTAIVVQAMVYGNMNEDSCTGVAFSRNPETGENSIEGEFCLGEGDDVNEGKLEPRHILELKEWGACSNDERAKGGPVFKELQRVVSALEILFGDVQEVEFTVEKGKLYVLQSGSATRSPKANVKIAVQLVNEGLITEREALLRVNALQMDYFLKPVVHPRLDPDILADKLIGNGLVVSSGAVTGEAVFTVEAAEQCFQDGTPCILVRNEASAADLEGIAAADGILCLEGGSSSYLVEICRPLNRTCIVGAKSSGLSIIESSPSTSDEESGAVKSGSFAVQDDAGQLAIEEGQIITLDGTSGRIINGPVLQVEEGINFAFRTILRWADKYRRLRVYADISSPEDNSKNMDFGSNGVGILRIDSLLSLGKKRELMLDYLLAYGCNALFTESSKSFESTAPILKRTVHALLHPSDDKSGREKLLRELEEALRHDIKSVIETNPGRSTSIAFFNTSLNSFLPPTDALKVSENSTSENESISLLDELSRLSDMTTQECYSLIEALRDINPLTGIRGCRYGLINPEFLTMQVRAALGAGLQVLKDGARRVGKVVFLVPMLSSEHETREIVSTIETAALDFFASHDGTRVDYAIGVLVQTPRACVRMDRIARIPAISSVLFDCDLLTELVFGMSKEDTESMIEKVYMSEELAITPKNPFETFDRKGVGSFINMAIRLFRKHESRDSRITPIGVCGNQTGFPSSIEFFSSLDVDFVCCSPEYLPTTKVAAAQSRIRRAKRHLGDLQLGFGSVSSIYSPSPFQI